MGDEQFDVERWQIISIILMGVIAFIHGRAMYWKAKYKATSDSGWEDEVQFWRHHVDNDSAMWANKISNE